MNIKIFIKNLKKENFLNHFFSYFLSFLLDEFEFIRGDNNPKSLIVKAALFFYLITLGTPLK